MALLPIASGRVDLTTAATAGNDVWDGGVRRANANGRARASTNPSTHVNQGITTDSVGVVSIVDATAGLPAGTVYLHGIPISGGKICYSTGAVTAHANGLPYVANGALAATVNP